MTLEPQEIPRRRLALILDGPRIAPWVASTIETLQAAPNVDLVGWLELDPPGSRSISRPWRVYLRFDARIFGGRSRATRGVEVADGLPRMTVERGIDPVRATLLAAELDVVLDLRSSGGPAMRAVARSGTWVIRHGSDSLPPGPLAYLADLAAGRGAAPNVLQVLADEAVDDRVVYRSVSAVSPVSLARTREAAFWKAAQFPIRYLRTLARGAANAADPADPADEFPPATAPTILRLLGVLATRLIRTGVSHLVRPEAWFVATRRRPVADLPADLTGFEPIAAPPGHFYADPSILSAGGRTYLFVEDWIPELNRGAITAIELDAAGRPVGAPRRALDRPYHLSYPFVFDAGGATYLLPETAGNRTIELYRALELPDRWEPLGALVRDVRASDPTLFHHEGRFWLFAGVTVPGGSPWDELWIWSAPALEGPWSEHPANPAVSDARSARPAGRVFTRDGVMYRPSQDCAPTYGRRIVINRIDELSLTGYRETPVATIEPRGIDGVTRTHCFDANDDIEVIDGRRPHRRRRRG